jgi:uncharacterized repeat protein (TIGR03806 family)
MPRRTFLALCLLLAGCTGVRKVTDEPFPKRLSEWRLFRGQLAKLDPNEGVLPYDVNTPLFSDYAAKSRFVWMPAGTAAVYDSKDAFRFPEGAVLAKTFSFDGRHIETRLLVNTKHGWTGLPYIWNQEQTDAILDVAPDPVNIRWKHPSGDVLEFVYMIPNQNQCKGCHEKQKTMTPIGPNARQLNRDFAYQDGVENQLVRWTKAGYLTGAPSPSQAPRNAVWNDAFTGSLDARARAYLDANCAHCHNSEGPADNTGLYLTAGPVDALRLGFCKVPVAAGHGAGDLRFDVVSGQPEESILIRRLNSTVPKVMMPELGRSTIHREGVELLREWIRQSAVSCDGT